MEKVTYYKYLFIIGALWNWILGLVYFITPFFMIEAFETFGITEPPSFMFYHLFFGAVFILGIGYYLVGTDLSQNHGIVIIGTLVKLEAIILIGYYFVVGDINLLGAMPVIGDLIFSVLFIEFLVNYKKI